MILSFYCGEFLSIKAKRMKLLGIILYRWVDSVFLVSYDTEPRLLLIT